MTFIPAAIRKWYWGGKPARRALVGVLITVILVLIIYPFDAESARLVVTFGLGWDIGAYAMDKAHRARYA